MLLISSFSDSLILAVVSTIFTTSTGQLLTAEYLNVKLPHVNPCPRPWYDGEDTIYLLGGCYPGPTSDILKFTISSETLEMVGRLPASGSQGTPQSDNFGNIFYIGGYRDVYKFTPLTNTTTTVAKLPYEVHRSISIKYNETSNTVFILGGFAHPRSLLSFDMETLTTTTISTNHTFSFYGGTAVRVGNKAYVFDDSPYASKVALEFDLGTYETQTVGPATFNRFDWNPTSVFDGNYAYVVGGYQPHTGHPTDGLIQFDPTTFENNFIPVRNFPVQGLNYFIDAPASVFVPSKNRIYFFGGLSSNYTGNNYVSHDEIFYVDLTPLVEPTSSTTDDTPSSTYESTFDPTTSTTLHPDFFTCINRPNGFYPHPSDCSLYIGCQNEELTIFRCSPPLLFDPVRKYCNFPEEVECGTSCIDRPDGPYPHPHDCSLFIMCRFGSSNLFKCPPPLLFNPEMRYCDFPDLVNCSITQRVNGG